MATYQIIGTAPNVSGIQLNEGFLDNDIVEINGSTYNSIGSGTGPIDISGANMTLNFKIKIVSLNQSFTLKAQCFQGLKVTEFTYPTAQDQTFAIEDDVFKLSKLTKFTLPNITNPANLGNGIFYQCTTLTDFSFGLNNSSNIDNIPQEMFYGCTALNTLTVPGYIETINARAFKTAIIQSLTLSSGLVTIGSSAFYSTTIPQLTIPDTVTTIMDEAFMESVIPIITVNETSTLTTIGMYAFKQSKMREFYFPVTLTKLGTEAFSRSNLVEVNLPIFTNYCEFEQLVFWTSSQLQSIVIGGKIKSSSDSSGNDFLSEGTFVGCTNLKTVQLYSGLKQISGQAFQSCTILNDITFPGTTPLSLGESCFYGCGFDYLHLPAHVNSIGEGAFSGCLKLQQVIIEAPTPTLTGNIFNGSNLMTELILSKNFTDFANADSFIVPNASFKFYVFTPTQRTTILSYAKYAGTVVYNPFHDRNFINVKAIYDDEHDPKYVMYTMASSTNTFNDCTFYFKEGNSSKPIVVIKQEGNMTNCVKMYSAITDDDDKTIAKIYYNTEETRWEVLLSGGTIKLPQEINQTYQLKDDFECPDVYTDTVSMIIDGSSLKQCDMFDLSNLTQNGYVTLESIDRVKLTSLRNNKSDEFEIVLPSTTGNQIFEVVDVDCAKLQLSGNTIATLVMEGTIKPRSYAWSIEAPKIVINNFTINYTLFQGQQQGVGEATLTKIECLSATYLIKFTADTIINFYTIQNKNNYMFHGESVETNALYYVSGWTMM